MERRGTKEIADFFKRVRVGNGYDGRKIGEFAEVVKIAAVHLGRVEGQKRLPGPDLMVKIVPWAIIAHEDPLELLVLWLRAQEMGAFADLIRRQT